MSSARRFRYLRDASAPRRDARPTGTMRAWMSGFVRSRASASSTSTHLAARGRRPDSRRTYRVARLTRAGGGARPTRVGGVEIEPTTPSRLRRPKGSTRRAAWRRAGRRTPYGRRGSRGRTCRMRSPTSHLRASAKRTPTRWSRAQRGVARAPSASRPRRRADGARGAA